MHNTWIDKWKKENTASTDSLDSTKALQIQQPAIESNVLRILENKELKDEMSNKQGPLNPREKLLLKYHLEGFNCKEIADKLNEDVRLTRSDLNAVKAKVRARLAKAKAKRTAPGLP
jgi:DNA-directed RNA polymerase specialized sigma24 family protein